MLREDFDKAVLNSIGEERTKDGFEQVFDVKMDRRSAFKKLTASLAIGAGAVSTSCSMFSGDESKEKAQIDVPFVLPYKLYIKKLGNSILTKISLIIIIKIDV